MISQQLESLNTVATSRLNRRSLLKRAGALGLSIPAAGVLLSACRTDDDDTTASQMEQRLASSSGATGQNINAAAAAPAEITITAVDLAFDPAEITVTAGQPVTLTFINNGAIEHDWDVAGMKVDDLEIVERPVTFTPRMEELLKQRTSESAPYAGAGPAEQMVITFTPTTAGTYEMICAVPGHAQAGMKGTFEVTGEGATAAASPTGYSHADSHGASVPAGSGEPYDAERLPNPVVAPPVGKREPQVVKQTVEIREVIGYLDDGVAFQFWTFGGTIPGPMLRARVGDTVELTLKNSPDSINTHNIDLHAVTGPGGGGEVTLVAPGESKTFRWKAMNPGVFVYHCATPPVAHHIAAGMYGLVVVEPEGGLPPVDKEFYVMQGDFYLEGKRGDKGLRTFSMDKMLDELPDYVVFNGAVGSLTEDRAFTAEVGETVRIFFGVGGPNVTSSFHVIGEIFDRVYKEGASEVSTNIQTTLVPTGGATIVEFTCDYPGTFILVDHSLGRAAKGCAGMLKVEGEENPEIFEVISNPT